MDLAGTVGDRTLRSCFERAAQKKLLDIPAIEASMDPGRRGMPSLRAGYATLRVTHREAEQEPEAIADTVATTLAARLPPAWRLS